jgi:predicted ArsR family transcriptional regulator
VTRLSTHYPHTPGYTDAETGAEAAAAIASEVFAIRRRVLLALRQGPATPDETAQQLGLHWQNVRPRFSELARMGLIKATGEKRRNRTGRRAKVWKLHTETNTLSAVL